MDNIKDTQKSSEIATVFSSHAVRTNPFSGNVSVERSYRRAERIVAALHLMTNHLAAAEPSRVAIREESMLLLSGILSVSDQSQGMRLTIARIRNLISLVRVLAVSGLISFQNTDTIIAALDELGVSLTGGGKDPANISKDDLVPSGDISSVRSAPPGIRPRSSLKDSVGEKDTDIDASTSTTISDIGQERTEKNRFRSQGIIDVLSGSHPLSIRDIAARLPEYSEKMIQRELAALVHDGVLIKTGEKRWSRYALVEIK